MHSVPLETIAEWSGGRQLHSKSKNLIENIVVDSRRASAGSLFVCLKGERTDGHLFIDEARKKGACIMGTSAEADIQVKSSLSALARMASEYRKRIPAKIAGVTGSCGKTTVTRMSEHILKGELGVSASPKSYNNLLGVSLSVLSIDQNDRAGILEIGTNHPGEIKELAAISLPDIALITNIADSHIGNFGSSQAILEEKMQLPKSLKNSGTYIYSADDELLNGNRDCVSCNNIVSYGFSQYADFKIDNYISSEEGVGFTLEGIKYFLEIIGRHNALNAAAASLVAKEYGISFSRSSEKLREFRLPPQRMQRYSIGKIDFIDDSYNASPASLKVLFSELLKTYPQRNIIAVVGRMNELGDYSKELHEEAGSFLGVIDNISYILAGGEDAESIIRGAVSVGFNEDKIFKFFYKKDAAEIIRNKANKNSLVVLKGSRLEKLEDIISYIK